MTEDDQKKTLTKPGTTSKPREVFQTEETYEQYCKIL
jgi:hypothetical protein